MVETLSLTQKHWRIADDNATHTDIVQYILQKRAVMHAGEVGTYADMPKAVERIERARTQKQKIGIFGDYDCDGVTAAAQFVRYCRRHDVPHTIYLPHRVHDGYGLQMQQVQRFADEGVQLLVTVDTGIASVEEIAFASSLGIDVIVTDHHTPGATTPNAYAILHPMVEKHFPAPHPSGAGVVYALLQALEGNIWIDKDIDTALASIGTVADLVPLVGSNRTLVQQGLHALQRLHSCALADLRDRTRSSTSADIAFRIAPRINAAGRMEDPSIALSAVLDGGEALALLDELNEQRQLEMKTMYESARKNMTTDAPLLWSMSNDYGHGIIGLIAGRFTEAYGKPSCVVTMQDDVCTASLRSPAAYHITEGLQRCSNHLISFGGHAQAAGCSFAIQNADAFCRALTADIAVQVNLDDLVPTIELDGVLAAEDITLQLVEQLQQLEPFGQGNNEPRFLIRNVQLEDIRLVGLEQTHVQCRIAGCKAIGFSLAHLEAHFGQKLDVVCRIGVDTWTGTKKPQLLIEDMRLTVPSVVPVV